MSVETVSTTFNDVEISLETGKVAKQAHGSVIAKAGETVVLAAVTTSDEPREGVDFFPLTVDFIEKAYSAGKIPGGFFKREARPTTDATLTARMTDRPIRPLFPKGFRNDVNIVITVLSYDGVNLPNALGMVAASAALSVSKIPFLGPIGAVVVGLIDDKLVINPSPEDLERSDLELAIAGTSEAVMMVEAGANEISEEKMLEALQFGHDELKKLIDIQNELVKKAGVEKMEVKLIEPDKGLVDKINADITDDMKKALKVSGKLEKYAAIDALKANLLEKMAADLGDEFESKEKEIEGIFKDIEAKEVRNEILNNKTRPDGRDMTKIRDLSSEVGFLPRPHGSALFTRGETQAMVLTTLGTDSDKQMIDGLEPTFKKHFYLHYNFPPYSVGEVGFMRGPGRRELGHGNLAERSLFPVLPDVKKFPHTIRIVSEITESNGSSSMASVCGGALSLMDAGVPIKAPVAGIAMGLIKEADNFVVLTDIAGIEDHLGDMDFKVAGTKDGITALQMDIKIVGVNKDIMTQALEQAHTGRMALLEHMGSTLAEPRKELSKYAPKIGTTSIDPSQIGELIGPGGKVIKEIQEKYGVDVSIDEEGTVNVAAIEKESIENAIEHINGMFRKIEVGDVFEDATVVKLMDFGAFVEVAPGKQGLVHISELANERVDKVEDVVKEGDVVKVKCIKVDDKGRFNYSIKKA